MVSIIIPVYNEEISISRCLDSVLNQSYSNIELIVVDDGSSDKSSMIIDSYASKFDQIKVFHKLNGGVSSARNLGLEQAKGEWVVFVDADDEIRADFLTSFFTLGDNAELLMQGVCKHNINTDTRTYIFEPTQIVEGSNIMPFVLATKESWQLGYICSKLYKRNIINNMHLRFNESYHQCEDLLFNLHYLTGCKKILNVDVANQYIYHWSKPKYKPQDFISMFFDQYEAMCKIMGADRWIEEIKAIYSQHILSYYIFTPKSPYKKKHKEKFISELYYYRDKLPISAYRKMYRLFLLISYLSSNKKYTSWLLGLF